MDQDDTTDAVTDALSNIPGIGPARKAALYAAGITTRAALAQASVEQLISLTGLSRTQAEKALETLHTTDAPALSAPSPQIAPPLADEAMPTVESDTKPAEPDDVPLVPDEDESADHSAQGLLDRAAFRTKTALSDATRVWDLPKLSKSMARLAAILDSLTERDLRPKAAKRLAPRLEDLSAGIERGLANEKPPKEKKQTQIRERLKSERIEIETAIKLAKVKTPSSKREGKPKRGK